MVCAMCSSLIPPRTGVARLSPTCSPTCKDARIKAQRKARYAQNRELAIAQAREWSVANPERIAELGRRYRQENKEAIQAQKRAAHIANPERDRQRSQAWHQANKERLKAVWAATRTDESRAVAAERTRQWVQANPERRAELRRKWAANNPEKVAIVRHRRRARLRGVPADNVTLTDLMISQDFLCHLCGSALDPECRHPDPMCPSLDHIVPLARGGTGLRENLAAAHLRCNVIKGAALPLGA